MFMFQILAERKTFSERKENGRDETVSDYAETGRQGGKEKGDEQVIYLLGAHNG